MSTYGNYKSNLTPIFWFAGIFPLFLWEHDEIERHPTEAQQ